MTLFWTQRQDIGPSARTGHALAYDEHRGRTVLFGGDGLTGAPLADTWEWDGHAWTQVQDSGPGGRLEHALAYDAARSRVVLFGGSGAGPAALADTWEWDGNDWTQVQDSGPSARSRHALAYDPARSRTVLFGGEDASGKTLADTWEWDGSDWTQVADMGPSARAGHAMSFDSKTPRVVVFGGAAASDTWAWDGSDWSQVNDIGPKPCVDTALASSGDGVFLFGGVDRSPTPPVLYGLTWQLDGKQWTERQNMGPAARFGHALAFDKARGRIVLFGGSTAASAPATGGDLRSDTWELPTPAGANSSGGGDPNAPKLVSFTVDPSSAPPGQDVTIQAILDRAATTPTSIQLLVDGGVVNTIEVQPGGTGGELTLKSDLFTAGTTTFGARLGAVTLTASFTLTG